MFLADAQQTAGLAEEAASTAASALAVSEQLGQRAWDAELLRLRGEALLQVRGPDDPEVESCLRRALATADAGESRFYALRAASSLARALARRGAVEEARSVLRGAVAAAPPELDAPDRQEIVSMLRSLA